MPPTLERRAENQKLSGPYTEGIVRVEKLAIEDLGNHDEELGKIQDEAWQGKYSLLNHSIRVSQVMVAIGEMERETDEQILLGCIAGLLHDTGKMAPECHLYRRNRALNSDEKRIIDTHADHSRIYVLGTMSKVRPGDRALLGDVANVAKFHHMPGGLLDPFLRKKAFRLRMADMFISFQEDRHRPGLSQFQAVDTLEDIVERELENPYWARYDFDLRSSVAAIAKLYGVSRLVPVPEALERG